MAEERQRLTCIGCPMGCPLDLAIVDGQIVEVSGYECQKGDRYARQEFTDPRRGVSTTVACVNGLWPRLPVKTAAPVPKERVRDVANALHSIVVTAPVSLGQVIVEDVAGTGVLVVATRTMPVRQGGCQ
jgi:CxxC motif-containing protein